MPWSYTGGQSKAKKKKQTRKPSRSTGMGRRLLNAGVAELLRELEEDKRKENVATNANTNTATTTISTKKPPHAVATTAKLNMDDIKKLRAQSFLQFLNKLPKATSTWRSENNVGTEHTPSGLSKHIKESILVFSFQTKNEKTHVIGATMYRRNNRKKAAPLDAQGQAVVCVQDNKIVHSWTNWSPNASVDRMRPGMFVWLFRQYVARIPLAAQICILQNEQDLFAKDEERGLDWRPDYTHYVFAENERFPISSGW